MKNNLKIIRNYNLEIILKEYMNKDMNDEKDCFFLFNFLFLKLNQKWLYSSKLFMYFSLFECLAKDYLFIIFRQVYNSSLINLKK